MVSSLVVTVALDATGASFTAVTVTVNEVESLNNPSVTIAVILVVPFQFSSGIINSVSLLIICKSTSPESEIAENDNESATF